MKEDKFSEEKVSNFSGVENPNSNDYENLLNKLNDIKERIAILEKNFLD